MKEPTPNTPAGEPEETLVTPRFDDVETVQAQPVVPLDEVPAGASRGRSSGVRRFASLPVALVLVSALVGVVVGGAGLYFYQHRSAQNSVADTQTTPAPAEAPPSTEESAAAPVQETAPAPKAEEADPAEVVSAEVVEPEAPAEGDAKKKEEADKSPAPEPRKVVERDNDDNDDSLKRGKKTERDSEAARRMPRAERVGSREQARDDDDGDGEPQARLSDEIIYRRERRAERQAERRERRGNRQRSVDRVRGIFEGQPE
jgi:hypothetical protein